MTELRKELNVTDEVHAELLFQAHDDESIRTIWYASGPLAMLPVPSFPELPSRFHSCHAAVTGARASASCSECFTVFCVVTKHALVACSFALAAVSGARTKEPWASLSLRCYMTTPSSLLPSCWLQ